MSFSRRSWPPWRGPELFDGRSSLRTRRYRIATNRCPNALRDKGRRPREVEAIAEAPEPTRRGEPMWPQPYPDALPEAVADTSLGPEARYEPREAVSPAFVAAPQHPPPRQRAALVPRDAPGLRAPQAADTLESSEAAVKGALQRARTTPKTRPPARDRARRRHVPRASASWSVASPTPSRAKTWTDSSRC